MTKAIRVKNTEDIQKINKIVTQFPFDVWIHGKSGMVDAKSLLGMFLLSLIIEDDIEPNQVKKLFHELEDYLDIDDDE